jgi:hypothetical protein
VRGVSFLGDASQASLAGRPCVLMEASLAANGYQRVPVAPQIRLVGRARAAPQTL